MDPADNALALEIDAVKIDRMSVIDHLGLGAAGADLAHVQSELETSILPKALGQIGKIPVTGTLSQPQLDRRVIENLGEQRHRIVTCGA